MLLRKQTWMNPRIDFPIFIKLNTSLEQKDKKDSFFSKFRALVHLKNSDSMIILCQNLRFETKPYFLKKTILITKHSELKHIDTVI